MTPGADDGEFLAAALAAVSRGDGPEVLSALGWWELLDGLDDPDARTAVFAVFRAQGRLLADSEAFGALLAHPYPGVAERGAGSVAATVERRSVRRGAVLVVVGTPPSDELLIDRPGRGVTLVPVADALLRPIEVPGGVALHEVDIDADRYPVVIPDGAAVAARRRSEQLGRTALALDLLGAAEAVLALAVAYAGDREQFGRPIGSFQAIRHLLARARTDCAAIESVAEHSIALDRAAPDGFGEVVKALAGRNARRVCEHALQTFGGVGFTVEHDHHRYHGRVLALDSLLGTSADLSGVLGARLRSTRTDPAFTTGLLLGGR